MSVMAVSRGRDSRAEAAQRLEEFAAVQHGYVTRAQAGQARVGDMMLRRLVTGGWIDRAGQGVYRMRGAHDLPWAGVWVAWLSLDPARSAVERAERPAEIVRAHTAASAVHGIGDLLPEPYDFWTVRRRFVRRSDIELHVGRLPREDIGFVQGLPVTAPVRTIADLVADHYDGGHVTDTLRDAIDKGLIDRRDLPGALADALRRALRRSRRGDADLLAEEFTEAATR
jgi:predicted transcriptional regulator of viral defense system